MAVILQLRKDISTAWISANPILSQGEVGLELDTKRLKVGDGVQTWIQLPYWTDASLIEKAVQYNGSTAVGSATQGVYVAADGTATVMTYELNKTVPSNAVFTDTTYSDFIGADGSTAGTAGLVPAPLATDNIKYLKGDGSWANVPAPNNGTLTIQVNGVDLQTFSADQATDVTANIEVPDSATWGNITGDIENQTDLASALGGKVDKVNTADKVYGTDANGDQTTYDKNSFGQVDDVTVGGTSVVTNKVAVLGSMAGETASDYSTTTVSNTLYAAKSLENTVSGIEAKIPSDATAQNQLADKDFVNSSIATQTANFIGTFENETALEAYAGTVTNNDYAFVINSVVTDNGNDWSTFADLDAYSKTHLTNMDYAWVVNGSNFDLYRFDIVNQVWELRATAIAKDSVSLNTAYNRYKAVVSGSTVTWTYEYTLNNSSFTAQQWASINSGITSSGVVQISTNETNIGNLSTLTTTAKTDLVSAINELDSGKQDNLPSQTGQSGKFLTTNGTTLSWGDSPVTDVQINSTSILSNGVANIPLATSSDPGVVIVKNGLQITNQGNLNTQPANEAQIIAKTHNYNSIVPANLDIAIREGLGNNSLTWTDAYKASARNTIGAEAKTATITLSATDSITLDDNTIYNGSTQTALTIALPATDTVGFLCEIDFSSGSTATTLSYPNTIKWLGDDLSSNVFVPVASKRYMVIITYDGVEYVGVVKGVA